MNRNRYILGGIAAVFALVLAIVLLTNQPRTQTQPQTQSVDQSQNSGDDLSSSELTQLVFVTVDNNGTREEFSTSIESEDKLINILNQIDSTNENFSIEYKEFDFGKMITTINGYTVKDNEFWSIKLNGSDAQMGVSDLVVQRGEAVEFILTTF